MSAKMESYHILEDYSSRIVQTPSMADNHRGIGPHSEVLTVPSLFYLIPMDTSFEFEYLIIFGIL